jgi:hypothetical protein
MDTQIQQALNDRVSWETLHSQIGIVKSNLTFKELSAARSENVFVLNAHRQIVFITRSCLDLFDIEDPATVYGCRLGEAMHCTNAQAHGCGVSKNCQLCGARNAALACLEGQAASQPFQLLQEGSEQAINFTINAEAITLEGQLFIMISLIQLS